MFRLSGGTGVRSHKAHWVGFSVAALTALISAVTAMTSANWANMLPVRPGTNAAGRNTAISTRVMPTTGPNQVVHRLDGRVVPGHALLDVFRHPLDDDDGVVDDDADRQHDAEQSREVDGEAERGHAGEGADDGDRHGRRRHQRGAEILQEDEDDDQHQDAGFVQRLVDLGDRVLDEDRRVVGDRVMQTLGEALRQLRHRVVDLLADLQRVRLGRLEDRDAGRGFAVDLEILRVGLSAELDPADVADMNEAAALGGLVLDDDVGELFRLVEPRLDVDGILKRGVARRGRHADLPAAMFWFCDRTASMTSFGCRP